MEKAPIGKRILAYIIDAILMTLIMIVPGIVLTILTVIMSMISSKLGTLLGILSIPAYLGGTGIGLLYLLVRDGLKGGKSIGKKVMKLKVVKDGKPCGYADSFLRNITLILGPIGLLDMLFALIDSNGQRIGDKIAKTQVVVG